MAIDKAAMPNGQASVENIKFALVDEKIDTNFVKVNLDSLNDEITRVGGDISRLGIKLDDLKHIHQKLDGKRGKFGDKFPVAQIEALTQIIEQAEASKAEKEAQNDNVETGSEFSPETVAKSDRSKIDSTIDAYITWRNLYTDSDLLSTGPLGVSINRQITDHLNKLKGLKGLEIVQKAKLPNDSEDQMIATIDNAQQLKNWHDKIMSQGQLNRAA